jgi:hypothetical protein
MYGFGIVRTPTPEQGTRVSHPRPELTLHQLPAVNVGRPFFSNAFVRHRSTLAK